MNVYNGDVGLVDKRLLTELITELRLLRLEVMDINKRLDEKAAQLDAERGNMIAERNKEENSVLFKYVTDLIGISFSAHVANALYRGGVYRIADLQFCTQRELKAMRMIGNSAMEEVLSFMEKNNIKFATKSGLEPIFEEGQKVVSLVDKSDAIKKGCVLVVQKVYPEYKRKFKLPTYSCKIEGDVSKYGTHTLFSRSELAKFK